MINRNNNKYDIQCLNILMMLSICKVEVDNLDMKNIINNLIKNGECPEVVGIKGWHMGWYGNNTIGL